MRSKKPVYFGIFFCDSCIIFFLLLLLLIKFQLEQGFLIKKKNFLRSHLLSAVSDLKSGFDLVLLYYGNVDTQGHIHGPESGQVREEVRR